MSEHIYLDEYKKHAYEILNCENFSINTLLGDGNGNKILPETLTFSSFIFAMKFCVVI